AVVHRQLFITDHAVTGEAMSLENGDYRAIDQATAVDRSHHIIVAVKLANQRNHGFREGFTINPLTKTLVGLLGHGQYLPHVGAEKRGYIIGAQRTCGKHKTVTAHLPHFWRASAHPVTIRIFSSSPRAARACIASSDPAHHGAQTTLGQPARRRAVAGHR